MTRPLPGRSRKAYRPLLAAGFVAFWIAGTVAVIAASGERGADSEADLLDRAGTALRTADASAFDEVLLDGADHAFASDFVERVGAAGTPELTRRGPDVVEIRSGSVATTLSVAQERGRWYLSLLPPAR